MQIMPRGAHVQTRLHSKGGTYYKASQKKEFENSNLEQAQGKSDIPKNRQKLWSENKEKMATQVRC